MVRFGIDVYFDLESTLDLQPWFWNVNLGVEFKQWDSGLICWNEEQPGSETLPDGSAGFDPFVGSCYSYEVRFCCGNVTLTDLTGNTNNNY